MSFSAMMTAPAIPVVLPARFVANRKALLNRLKSVSAFSPRKGFKPILQTVRLSVNGTVELTATNQESWITTHDDFERSGDRHALIHPSHLAAVLKTLKADTTVNCEIGKDSLTVRGSAGELSIPLETFVKDDPMDPASPARKIPEELPEPKAEDCYLAYTVESAKLQHALSQTLFATDTQSTRYALGGVAFDLRESALTLVATDGRRLATSVVGNVTVDVFTGPESDTINNLSVVPTAFLANLKTFLESTDTVKIGFSDNHIIIVGESAPGEWFSAISRLVEGRFPKYQDVIPASSERELTFETAGLVTALMMASVATNEECRGIDIEIPDVTGDTGMVVFSCDNRGTQRTSKGQCVAAQTGLGKPIGSITFDPRYILEYLHNLPKSAKHVTLALINGNSAAVLTAQGETGKYVAMPLSRDR